jgi:multiple sugar transport system permease protein
MIGRGETLSVWKKLALYAILVAVGIVMAYPFFFMVTNSLKTTQDVFANLLAPFGSKLDFSNYTTVLKTINMGLYMVNTLFVAIFVVTGQVLTSMMGGYAFARMDFPGRDWIFRLYLATIMVPFMIILIPSYKLMLVFGWVDKFQALIIPWLFTAMGTFLFRQFYKGMPKELEEAAIIDGSSRWGILWKIFAPLSMPVIATQATLSFLYAWNSFIWPLVIISSKDRYVVTQGLADLKGAYFANVPYIMAGATLAIIPTVLVFLLAQRYFVEGVATTGLKG